MYRPDARGMFTRLCGACFTIMARDIIKGTCWCVNDKCQQYQEKFHL